MPPDLPIAHHPPVNCQGSDEETAGWYIPRPALCRSDHTSCTACSGLTAGSGGGSVREWLSPVPSSNSSTQSGSSGSLLLTAANLAALRLEPVLSGAPKDPDSTSLASSTHFTMVNYPSAGGAGRKEKRQSLCARHHVSTIVLSVSALFLIGLMAAVYYIDMRSRSVRYSR